MASAHSHSFPNPRRNLDVPIRPVPRWTDSIEAFREYNGDDLAMMRIDDLRRDLMACDMAIILTAPRSHWWYFRRCAQIRALLASAKGAA